MQTRVMPNLLQYAIQPERAGRDSVSSVSLILIGISAYQLLLKFGTWTFLLKNFFPGGGVWPTC